jgi:membrane-bound inhibitor of C-type lysozyme
MNLKTPAKKKENRTIVYQCNEKTIEVRARNQEPIMMFRSFVIQCRLAIGAMAFIA